MDMVVSRRRAYVCPTAKNITNTNYTPTTSPLSLRDAVGSTWPPVEVRRCRFMATEPAALPPMRLVGEYREEDRPPGIPVVVDDRGRVEEAASFGRELLDLREALCGVPDARFLSNHSQDIPTVQSIRKTDRFLITSVFNDRGRTTPWSF